MCRNFDCRITKVISDRGWTKHAVCAWPTEGRNRQLMTKYHCSRLIKFHTVIQLYYPHFRGRTHVPTNHVRAGSFLVSIKSSTPKNGSFSTAGFRWQPTTILVMVLILDGKSEHVAHAWRKKLYFRRKNPICALLSI